MQHHDIIYNNFKYIIKKEGFDLVTHGSFIGITKLLKDKDKNYNLVLMYIYRDNFSIEKLLKEALKYKPFNIEVFTYLEEFLHKGRRIYRTIKLNEILENE